MRKEHGLATRDLVDRLRYSGVRRRDFLKFCGVTAGLLGLSEAYIPSIANALEKSSKRPPVVWLNFASDSGCTESLIKATYPNAADLVLDILSIDYNETIMAAAGRQVEEILQKSLKEGNYILVIEGGIPTKHGYGMIAGKDMMDIAKEFAQKAIAILAVGSCATHGGVPAANPNPSAIKGVSAVLGDAYKGKIVNLDLCPVNVEVLVAVIVNYLLFKKLPELDSFGRPKTFYSQLIHDNCERRAHFDAGRFVAFFSRFDADWKDFSIIQNLKGAPEMIAYYTFLKDKHTEYRKYNPLQAFTYLSWAGIIALQALTGFALYRGDVFGLFSAQSVFGWLNSLLGGESFTRIWHFLIMWYFIITAAVHVYMSLLQTFVKRDRTFQSMFTGYKLSSAKRR